MSIQSPHILYYCLEIGISDSLKTYAGGLGILAGDTLKTAADMGLPMVCLTLLYKNGYFKQLIQNGKQVVEDDHWNWESLLTPVLAPTEVSIGTTTLLVKVWKYMLAGKQGHVPIYFLDADIEGNPDQWRETARHLYPANTALKLRQELLLGVAGTTLLPHITDQEFDGYHLNESHAAFALIPLLQKYSPETLRKKHIFTTHTPIASGHERYHVDMITAEAGPHILDSVDPQLIEDSILNLTEFCLHYSGYANGVSRRHQQVTYMMYPNFPIDYVTNGVHVHTWMAPEKADLISKYVDDWDLNPHNLRRVSLVPDAEFWDVHQKSKKKLCDYLNGRYHTTFNPSYFTIGFARRAAEYKRADLIFSDIQRIDAIAKKYGKLQIIFSGKAHPSDIEGQAFIEKIYTISQDVKDHLEVYYIPDYGIEISQHLVAGVDLWLNNPIVPKEASGTSGMKASLNGIPNLSTLDGWWIEGCIEGVTGWSIGGGCEGEECTPIETEDLYTKLETQILPTYFESPIEWAKIQKNCIVVNGSYFTGHRMLEEYLLKAYIPTLK